MTSNPTTTHLQFQTPHYSFKMKFTEKNETYQRYNLMVGSPEEPCIECIITTKYLGGNANNRLTKYENTAKLIKIDALEECALEDISTEYFNRYSFGKELLDAIVFFINSQFQEVKTVSLDDSSYIPCKRAIGDILDLLTYSIALYKKTWYEEKVDAYLLPKERHESYRKEVDTYASRETKEKITFKEFYNEYILPSHNSYAIDKIQNDSSEIISTMFDQSETFPDFFKALNRTIPREDKCKFFKSWLEKFINDKIRIVRSWHFDLYPKITILPERKNNTTRRVRKN